MARRLTALVLLLMLVGCGRAPETTQVRQDLANRLAEVYGSGMFEIAAVDGRGSSADSTSPPGGERRVVYYDAELKPMRDIDLGAWNTPGVASLVTVLGAGPRGITGVKPGGNKAGDQILAHGTAIYRLEGDAWHEVTPASFTPPVAPALATISPPSPSDRLLTALHDAVHALPAGTTPGERAVIDQELERALAAIQSRLTRLRQG
ncbi:MAG: hypothetical protein JOY71_27890, partial [Acetobacteraceae bacterium]|nr:hypothetical protein [Acetobacteraceae bacterium]